MPLEAITALLLPFAGTALGAACVFFLHKPMNRALNRGLTGFAAGVMVAASIWSLIIPAMEQSAHYGFWAFFPALIGIWAGILFLLLLDHWIPHLHQFSTAPEGHPSSLGRSAMMVLAVTLHNLPEGMAVGVVIAGWLEGSVTAAAMLVLSMGIALQNLPEGAIVSMPLASNGMRKYRACGWGILSGIVEPIGAALTLLLAELYNKRAAEYHELASPLARRALQLLPGRKAAHNAIFDALDELEIMRLLGHDLKDYIPL